MAITNLSTPAEERKAARAKLDSLVKTLGLEKRLAAMIGERSTATTRPNEMQEVIPGVFISNYIPASRKDLLHTKKVTHVCCCIGVEPRFPDDFSYLTLNLEDSERQDIAKYFGDAIEFIDGAVKGGGRVLIHCGAGISRSGAITVAYLMHSQRMPLDVALGVAQSARAMVSPNPGFMRQLRAFEAKLFATAAAAAAASTTTTTTAAATGGDQKKDS